MRTRPKSKPMRSPSCARSSRAAHAGCAFGQDFTRRRRPPARRRRHCVGAGRYPGAERLDRVAGACMMRSPASAFDSQIAVNLRTPAGAPAGPGASDGRTRPGEWPHHRQRAADAAASSDAGLCRHQGRVAQLGHQPGPPVRCPGRHGEQSGARRHPDQAQPRPDGDRRRGPDAAYPDWSPRSARRAGERGAPVAPPRPVAGITGVNLYVDGGRSIADRTARL